MTGQDEDGSIFLLGNDMPHNELKIDTRSEKYQILLEPEEGPLNVLQNDLELDIGGEESNQNPTPTSVSEYWRTVDVTFGTPTVESNAADNCGMLITPAPILQARADDNGELAALSNSAAAASRSASAGIAQAQASATAAISSISAAAAASISSASESAASVSSSASSALSSMSSKLSSIEASASSAVAAANASAASAISAASILVEAAKGSVNAAGSSFLAAAAQATSDAQMSIMAIGAAATQLISQSQAQAQASQALAVSSTNAAIAIVVSIIGSAIVTFLIFFFVIRYRRKRLGGRENQEISAYRYPRSGDSSYRDSVLSVGTHRSEYKDEKPLRSISNRERSPKRYRKERGWEKDEFETDKGRGRRGRSDSRGSSDYRPSKHEKESSSSRTRVGSTTRSMTRSFSEYSPYEDFSPGITKTRTELSDTYPVPKMPQSPHKRLYNPDPVLKEPEKVAKKPERIDTEKARKNHTSMAPTTGSTTGPNLTMWLRDQSVRTSTFPAVFTKPDTSQPFSRGPIERPEIQIPPSVAASIVEGPTVRGSVLSVETNDFPEGFVAKDESHRAEWENANRDTLPAMIGTAEIVSVKGGTLILTAKIQAAKRAISAQREAERKEAERRVAQRREGGTREAERKPIERKPSERKPSERKLIERKEAEKQEAEREGKRKRNEAEYARKIEASTREPSSDSDFPFANKSTKPVVPKGGPEQGLSAVGLPSNPKMSAKMKGKSRLREITSDSNTSDSSSLLE